MSKWGTGLWEAIQRQQQQATAAGAPTGEETPPPTPMAGPCNEACKKAVSARPPKAKKPAGEGVSGKVIESTLHWKPEGGA